jgi:hypothetical protein
LVDDLAGGWWLNAAALFVQLEGVPLAGEEEWYRIGDGYLRVCSADVGFRERLKTLFRECAVAPPDPGLLPRVGVTVRSLPDGSFSLVSFDDPEPLDQLAFSLALFPDRGYSEIAAPSIDWKILGVASPRGLEGIAMRGPHLLVPRTAPWQSLAGSLAFSRLVRLQKELLYFHAGSIGMRGAGLLLVGPKGSGKTTLSLALAARGHDFLGDEMAGVRVGPLELVPIRRSLAVRDGARALDVSRALERVGAPYEPFPDGTERRRAYAAELFPGTAAPATPLRDIVFLNGFGARPLLQPVAASRGQLGLLTPLGATMWGANPVRRARDLISVITRARCWTLQAGAPDETAALLEQHLEE